MAYADLLEDEGINSQFLGVLKPRRKVTTFSVFSGSVYVSDFTLGQVINTSIDGSDLTEGASTSLSSGEWFYDVDNSKLYVRTSGDTDPSNDFVVATYEIYVGTFDAHFPRIPTDAESSSNRTVYYEPIIAKSPVLKQTNKDVFFGFLPSQTSQIVLTNTEHELEPHVSESSFNLGKVEVYHWLGDLEKDNIKLVYSGVMGSISYTDERVTIQTFESLDILETEYRNSTTSFFALSDFTTLDPKFQGRPIRVVYGGPVDGFVPVNIDFDDTTPTTSDNREWVVQSGQTGLSDISRTVPASPVSTTTRTYVDDATGFAIGDGVWINKAANEYVLVINIDYSSNFIEHAAIGIAAVNLDLVKRAFVSKVIISQSGVNYTALYDRDYIIRTDYASTTSGFEFRTTMEANIGLPNTLSPSDRVQARVYGRVNDVTLGGPAFGADDSKTGNLRQGVVILFDLLKKLGITESEINTSSFTTAQSAVADPVAFTIPRQSNQDFPKYKDLIIPLLQTLMLRFYIDNDRKFTITEVAAFTGSATKTVEDDEILDKTLSYSFSYSDVLSQINIDYAFRQIPEEASATELKEDRITASSETAKFLHGIRKSKSFKSLHSTIDLTEATALAAKMRSMFGDRRGTMKWQVKNRFFDTLIADTIDVTRSRMPGFTFDVDTDRTQRVVITGVDRSLKRVTLITDDQKGVEDNSGDF